MTQTDPTEKKPVQGYKANSPALWKRFVFGLFYYLGLNTLARVITRNKPRILMFHHISEEGQSGLTPSKLNRMLAYIADRYEAMTVSQLVQYMGDHGQYIQSS